MNRKTKIMIRRFFWGFLSFCFTLAALIAVPYLQDVETCVPAALVITFTYGFFGLMIYVNLVRGRF